MSKFSPLYFEQPLVIFDTTESLNPTTGSFVLYGGISVNSTYGSTNPTTGSATFAGGVGIKENLNVFKNTTIDGIVTITNTSESTGIGSGSLILSGGLGMSKDLNVGGDVTVVGNLYVNGTTTNVNTQTLNVEDNTIVINAGPAGSRDAGLLIHRDGVDVVSETAVTSGTLAAIASGSFTLGSAFIQNYSGWWIKTTEGSAQIASYNGTTGTFLTTGNTFTTPTELDFSLYNKSYVAQYYDETNDELRFGFVGDATDPKVSLENNGQYAKLRLDTLYANTALSTANLSVTNSATIANLSLSSAVLDKATIGSLFVTGNSTLSGLNTLGSFWATGSGVVSIGLTAGSLNVTGDSLIQGNVTMGALWVTGASVSQLGLTAGSLNVTGNSLLQGNNTLGSFWATGSGVVSLGLTAGSLNITGDSLIQGNVTMGGLWVTGASVSQLGLTAGSLNVTGDSLIQGNVTMGGLWVTGASVSQFGLTAGSLNVTQDSVLHGFVTVGALNVTGYSILESLNTLGSLAVSSASYFGDDVLITGGNLTVTSGSIVFNTVDVSPSMADIVKERSATIGNNISSATDVLDFSFLNSVARAFDAIVSVAVSGTTSNTYAYYNLKGVQKATGSWVMNSSFVGDVTGVVFSITSGQIQYTSSNKPDFSSAIVKFKALTTTV